LHLRVFGHEKCSWRAMSVATRVLSRMGSSPPYLMAEGFPAPQRAFPSTNAWSMRDDVNATNFL